MEYLIINIKNPDLGPQAVHPSVWNDEKTLKDMGYMRYEGINELMKNVNEVCVNYGTDLTTIEQAVNTVKDQYTPRKRKTK